jgi:hypothetical protein
VCNVTQRDQKNSGGPYSYRLRDLSSPNIISIIKSRTVRWMGHSVQMGENSTEIFSPKIWRGRHHLLLLFISMW